MQLESGHPIGFMVIKLVTAGGGRQRKREDATSVNWLGLVVFFLLLFCFVCCYSQCKMKKNF